MGTNLHMVSGKKILMALAMVAWGEALKVAEKVVAIQKLSPEISFLEEAMEDSAGGVAAERRMKLLSLFTSEHKGDKPAKKKEEAVKKEEQAVEEKTAVKKDDAKEEKADAKKDDKKGTKKENDDAKTDDKKETDKEKDDAKDKKADTKEAAKAEKAGKT